MKSIATKFLDYLAEVAVFGFAFITYIFILPFFFFGLLFEIGADLINGERK